MPPSPPSNHPVIAAIRWVLQHRTQPNGRRLSMRALSRLAELSQGHVEQIINGRQSPDIERSTAVKLARAGNVRVSWLLTGHGEREPFDEGEVFTQQAPSATFPRLVAPAHVDASSERHWSSEQVEDWLVEATDKTRHRGKHVTAVRRLLLELPALIRKNADMIAFTERALDAAAVLDARDEPITPSELLYEMTMASAPRPATAHARGQSRWGLQGDGALRTHGAISGSKSASRAQSPASTTRVIRRPTSPLTRKQK